MEKLTDLLKGLEIVDAKEMGDGELALLLSDGVVLHFTNTGYSVVTGPSWYETWQSLTS